MDWSQAITIDSSGNCYVTGFFSGTATFGTTQITSSGERDIFIAKYDTDGNFQWVRKAGGTDFETGTDISIDASGNCYVTGHFQGTATFGTTQITSSGNEDIFIAKYDTDGNFQWVRKAGGVDDDKGQRIAIDNLGNLYITGIFQGIATFETTQLTSSGWNDIFIAKYDTDGNFQWVRKAGGTGNDVGYGIAADASGNCYVTGETSFGQFGNITINGIGFITKLTNSFLNITSPLGGEIWQTNTTHNITWNSNDDVNIKIEITTDNGLNWLPIQNSVNASTGNFTFTIPPLPNSNQCRIRLTSLSYGNVSTTSGLFTITSDNVPNLTVTSPNTSVKWLTGSTKNITWIKTGNIDNVKLEYTTNNGNNWITIVSSVPADNQSYAWTIPNTPSGRCRVRVSDVNNSALNDVSDELFTIANISITEPSLGRKWRASTQKEIKWNIKGLTSIYIHYTTNNGTTWNYITNMGITDGSGSYNWNLPNLASTQCRIRIQDASDNTVFSISDIFEIWWPITSTQTPSGTGTVNTSFGATNITFNAFIMVANPITVTYYQYEAPQSGTLPNGVVNVSQYYWNITTTNATFFNGYIRVPLSTLAGVNDPTKLVWLKRENSGDPWTNIGGTISEGNLVSTNAFNSFSEFAIGSTDNSNPLPVELTNFNASVFGKGVLLKWKTETEVNNFGFEIERKYVNEAETLPTWEQIGFVKGSGNSNSPKEYSFKDISVQGGKVSYRLKQIDSDGSFSYSQEIEIDVVVPKEFKLYQNYPNPFNPTTTISFTLEESGLTTLKIYNEIGEEVMTLINNEYLEAGLYHRRELSAFGLASGMYIARLQSGNKGQVIKMMLLK